MIRNTLIKKVENFAFDTENGGYQRFNDWAHKFLSMAIYTLDINEIPSSMSDQQLLKAIAYFNLNNKIPLRTICLEWNDDGVQRHYLMVDEEVDNETIEKLIDEALKTRCDEVAVLTGLFDDNNIVWSNMKCEFFDFN